MQRRFDTIIRGLFPEGGTVLLAVSGGMDSMCMASLFLNSDSAPKIAVANCNFNLRGEESDRDSAMVSSWCEARGVKCHMASFPTLDYAQKRGLSTEMAARELRYGWFDSLCREFGYSALAVAHNQNDNAETLMLNLLRGTGVKGMCGMKLSSTLPYPRSEVTLVRPLLGFSREEISGYVRDNAVPYRDDSTNFGTLYRRNKVRNLVFPLLKDMNPSFLEAFSRDMVNLSQLSAFADSCYGSIRPSLVLFEDDKHLKISVSAIRDHMHGEYLLYRLLEPYGFAPADISSLSSLLKKDVEISGRQFFSESWRLVTTSSEILVCWKDAGCDDRGDEVTVVRGTGIYTTAGVTFSVATMPWNRSMKPSCEAGVTMADASVLDYPFIVRTWRQGDWMRPMGLRGKKKLSDMFVDLKMSLFDKERALVAISPKLSGDDDASVRVMSLLGKRIDEQAKVSGSTESVVVVRILS